MGADLHDSVEQEAADAEDDGLTISRSNALVPLLVLFGATVLGILTIIVHAEPFVPHEGATADRAYRPSDFPKTFGKDKDDALVGIEGGKASPAALVAVPPPPFSEGMFPCMECHVDRAPDAERRVLKLAHDDIVLHHDEEHRWCLDCHDEKNRDSLRLASGALVPFTESYRLCGQCHGPQYRDWKTGIHGRRTGFWDGPKRYLLCVHCHNPHSPRFQQMVPFPPPVRPQYLATQGGAHEEASHGGH